MMTKEWKFEKFTALVVDVMFALDTPKYDEQGARRIYKNFLGFLRMVFQHNIPIEEQNRQANHEISILQDILETGGSLRDQSEFIKASQRRLMEYFMQTKHKKRPRKHVGLFFILY